MAEMTWTGGCFERGGATACRILMGFDRAGQTVTGWTRAKITATSNRGGGRVIKGPAPEAAQVVIRLWKVASSGRKKSANKKTRREIQGPAGWDDL